MANIRKVAIESMVGECLNGAAPVVLAVSGGRDSMVLLDVAARIAPRAIAAVATWDHRTGPWSTRAALAAAAAAGRRGIPVVTGVAPPTTGRENGEAALRAGRWKFLHAVGEAFNARIATAHTASDQAETICMRILRGSGARGLSGMRASAPGIVRPLLDVTRETVAAYASHHGVSFVEDPTNASVRWFRNRIRHDLLPALERAHPGFENEMVRIGERAAAWRQDVERVVDALGARRHGGALHVAVDALRDYDSASLAMLWPAIAARLGLALDRRGTLRAASFTRQSVSGDVMPLSGGFQLRRGRDDFVLDRRGAGAPSTPVMLCEAMRLGRWRLERTGGDAGKDPWRAWLPARSRLTVRAWQDGDRMQARADGPPRRVKRFFRDAGIPGPERAGWPVVLADDEIVWIPGVRRREGEAREPSRLLYACQRDDG